MNKIINPRAFLSGRMARGAILALILVGLAKTKRVLAQQEYSATSSLVDEDYTDNAIDLVPTTISSLEDFLLTISNPFRIFNRPEDQLDRNTERFFLGLPPGIREVFFAGRSITQNGFGQVMNQYRKRIQAIFPGTRWCGSGDVARSPNDIGIFSLTDTCCRTHDACPEYVLAGSSSRGLKNNGIFARSHCSCDEEFYQCLKNTHTLIAKKIGITYFDVLQPQCFKLEYPIKRCLRFTSFPGTKRCVLYEFDTSGNKTWQWFDNAHFLGHF
ncbi:phospholipase A2-like isoform X1 [Neodiprion fabricii]|uniref:phospholipase A2-like isoform X1 n=2 Tax=Neodiprion fabricii TaxID=2872261 RepID=UPI001ED9694B|nr:phospholipase A2-like isoform X1 [Neodiprion fabricii]